MKQRNIGRLSPSFCGAWKRLSFFQISETVRVELLHMQLLYRLFESLLHLFCFVSHKESILRNVVNGFRHGGDRSSCVCFGFDNSRNPKISKVVLEQYLINLINSNDCAPETALLQCNFWSTSSFLTR
ncbi:hypothetical protein YC2023_116365 [Brassica napus]